MNPNEMGTWMGLTSEIGGKAPVLFKEARQGGRARYARPAHDPVV